MTFTDTTASLGINNFLGIACFSISNDDSVANDDEGLAFIINQLAGGPEIERVQRIVQESSDMMDSYDGTNGWDTLNS